MIKVAAFFKRREGSSVEDFQSYWRTHHADLAKQFSQIGAFASCKSNVVFVQILKP